MTGGGGTSSTGGGRGGWDDKRARRPPRYKIHHCALHRDEEGKYCFSDSCLELKRMNYLERIELLQENGDCPKCCRDCPKGGECLARYRRVCGGDREGRGCSEKHEGHELFCAEAKCFTISSFASIPTPASGDARKMQGWKKEDPVKLLVMKIPSFKPASASYETVLWDPASSGIFVRNSHARLMNFPSRSERMTVCTLGGDVKEIDGVVYRCRIKDLDGREHEFLAHGLDEVTGRLSHPMTTRQVGELFPHLKSERERRRLIGSTEVDYLIGLGKASWQPQKVTKAQGGGDL